MFTRRLSPPIPVSGLRQRVRRPRVQFGRGRSRQYERARDHVELERLDRHHRAPRAHDHPDDDAPRSLWRARARKHRHRLRDLDRCGQHWRRHDVWRRQGRPRGGVRHGGCGQQRRRMCTADCKIAVCGDGKVHVGAEACDLGPDNGDLYGGCGDCQLNAFCGDGVLDSVEQCDAGIKNGSGEGPEKFGAVHRRLPLGRPRRLHVE